MPSILLAGTTLEELHQLLFASFADECILKPKHKQQERVNLGKSSDSNMSHIEKDLKYTSNRKFYTSS